MTEADYFGRIDAEPQNTILVFDDVALADRYVAHLERTQPNIAGTIIRVEDTRTGSGLLTQWRNPLPIADLGAFARKQREALWLLEEVLAGRVPRPAPGKISNISAVVEASRHAQTVGLS